MIEENTIGQIIDGEVQDKIATTNFDALSSVIENENVLYLLYADFLTKTFYLINPVALYLKKQDKFQELFFHKWAYFSKNNLLINEKWKVGVFKFNGKKVISENDIPLILCFESLQNNQKSCKIDVHTFKIKRKFVLMKIEDQGEDLQSFCSSCGDNFLNNNNVYRCMCRRKFHVDCMDMRYSTNKLYDYKSFHCFFCRRDSEKNIFRI
jgi:hypothetical protein